LLPTTVHPLTPPSGDQVAFPFPSNAVSTSPKAGTPELIAKPTVRTVPLTSNAWPGANEPTPTLPDTSNPFAGAAVLAYVADPIPTPPTMDNEFAVVHVPMPTLPFVTANAVCNANVPIPTLPLTVSPVIRTVPLTSKAVPGARDPTPTLPDTNNPFVGAAVLA